VNGNSPDSVTAPADAVPFPVRLAGGERWFFRPSDPERILNSLTDDEFGRDEQLPYWAEHWPSSEVAAAYFHAHPFPADWIVYELGCGLGTTSAIIGEHCAVVASDIAQRGCEYTRANLLRYGLPPRVVRADWRHVPLRPGTIDAVIGSDILYEERWIEPVVEVLRRVLRTDGTAYITDPCRRSWRTFLDRARQTGMQSSVVQRTATNGGRTTIEIARLTNTGASALHD